MSQAQTDNSLGLHPADGFGTCHSGNKGGTTTGKQAPQRRTNPAWQPCVYWHRLTVP